MFRKLLVPAVAFLVAGSVAETKKKHHKKHHKKHNKDVAAKKADAQPSEQAIVDKLKKMEGDLSKKAIQTPPAGSNVVLGKLQMNGPLSADFNELFVQGVVESLKMAHMTVNPADVKVTATKKIDTGLSNANIVEVSFTGPQPVVHQIKVQAGQETSPLASGVLEQYLVAKETDPALDAAPLAPKPPQSLDIDTDMPFGDLEPFGREDTANELTAEAIKESDAMVDQMERAEVAEEKRSVFRALTRLRGAAITSFDGVARSQTGNIDEYNHTHKWRKGHPIKHLAAEEADTAKWAFPTR